MARSKDGKVYAYKAGLTSSISILDTLIGNMDTARNDIFEEMGNFLENYDSPKNYNIFNEKKGLINRTFIDFLDGERKVVNKLLPDVIDRFNKGYIHAMKAHDVFGIVNDSTYRNTVINNANAVNNGSVVSKTVDLDTKGKMSNSDDTAFSSVDVMNMERASSAQNIQSSLLQTSNMNIKSIEIVGFMTNTIAKSGSRMQINVNYQVRDVDNKRYVLSADINLPLEGNVNKVDLVLVDDINNINPDLLKDGKQSIVITPIEFNPTIVAKLVLEIASNPIEFVNNIVVGDSKLELDLNISGALEIENVSMEKSKAKLELILEEKEYMSEVKNTFVVSDSKLKLLDE